MKIEAKIRIPIVFINIRIVCIVYIHYCDCGRIGSSLHTLSDHAFVLHWAVFFSLLWTAFLWAVLLSCLLYTSDAADE